MLQKIKAIKEFLQRRYTGLMEKMSPATRFVYWAAFATCLLLCPFFAFFWIPSAGVAVGALGAAGVFVAIRGEKVKDGEKVLWAFITLVFLVTEVRAIYKDRAEQNEKQAETVTEIISNSTGGDSICYLGFDTSGSNAIQAVFIQRGKYPLRNVHARIVDLQKMNRFTAQGIDGGLAMQMAQLNVALGDLARKEALLKALPLSTDDQEERSFNVFFMV
jgi:hypothetical protein